MKLRSSSPLLVVTRGRDFILKIWIATLRGGLVSAVMLVLSLSGCDERGGSVPTQEWACEYAEVSSLLQKQVLYQHDEALLFCQNLTRYGQDDWRLPTKQELMIFSLQAQIQNDMFSLSSRAATCWSSTPYDDSSLRYWAVSVSNKQAAPLKKDTFNAVICVRDEVR